MIKYGFYLFLLILVLSYFGFDIQSFMSSDLVQKNLSYVFNYLIEIWNNYLKPIYDYLASILGPSINDTLNKLQNGGDITQPYNLQIPKIIVK